MIYERNLENYENSKKAREVLEHCKEIENKMNLHECRINKRTIVCCKNKNNIERYKLKEKKEIVCLKEL